jgi:tryptophan-rich sensory protein
MNYTLLYNIFIPVILAIIINSISFGLGWTKKSKDNKMNPLLPPGYVIGIVWIIILGLIGYVHYEIFKLHNNHITFTSLYVVFFILFCLAYPFLTLGYKEKIGLLLNLITLILAFILSLLIIIQSKYIFIFLIPLLLWVTYVNFVFVIECSKFY